MTGRLLLFLVLFLPMNMCAKPSSISVEDTGSTNRPGLRVTLDREGHATVEPSRGETQHVNLPADLCRRMIQDVSDAGALNELPTVHCMKSASFGSRLFIEWNGDRSPDLSCPGGQDRRSQTLQKDANDILQAAREAANIPAFGRTFTVPAPRSP